MWTYEYQATHYATDEHCIFLASDSLNNLKKEIRNRHYDLAWITSQTGVFSYGQNLIESYPYKPRY